mmetsp:Transcript_11193/g.26151  ORF Transcript_11193/g.26151 Transcript_11193/m.26151 type:complete len:312 (-) Transcript_11193:188-1123(-)
MTGDDLAAATTRHDVLHDKVGQRGVLAEAELAPDGPGVVEACVGGHIEGPRGGVGRPRLGREDGAEGGRPHNVCGDVRDRGGVAHAALAAPPAVAPGEEGNVGAVAPRARGAEEEVRVGEGEQGHLVGGVEAGVGRDGAVRGQDALAEPLPRPAVDSLHLAHGAVGFGGACDAVHDVGMAVDEGVLDGERSVGVVDLAAVVLHIVLVEDEELPLPGRRVVDQGLEAVAPVQRQRDGCDDLGPRDLAAGRHVDDVAEAVAGRGQGRREATVVAGGVTHGPFVSVTNRRYRPMVRMGQLAPALVNIVVRNCVT